MTAARQERKPCQVTQTLVTAFWAVIVAMGLGLGSAPIWAATTELVVVNRFTGLAIDGFDPVAYFADGSAKIGRPELEIRYAGATWRFHNVGNHAAFAANPAVYSPRFGGYDPTAVARGAGTAGNPEIWLILEKRLYLFFGNEARDAFIENHERAIEAAERRWPEVLRTLSP
jgi:hypothetical protein